MRSPLPTVLACHFLAAFTTLGVPIYLPRLLSDFGVSEQSAWSGILFSLPVIMTALSSAWWGRFADRYGRRLSLQRALLGLTLAFILAGISPSMPWLISALILQGLAGGTLSAANGYLSLHVREQALAKALNWTQFSARVALLSAPPLIGGLLMLFPHIGQRLWLWLSLLPLCGLALSLRLPAERAQQHDAEASPAPRASGNAPYRLWIVQFLLNFAIVVTFPYFLPYAARWLHQEIAVGGIYSWPHLVYLLILPFWHRLTGRRGYFVAGTVLIALAGVWQVLLGDPRQLLAARTLFGLGILMAYSGMNQLIGEMIDRRTAGKQFGQIDAAGKWAGVAAGVSAGWLVSHGSLQTPYLASAAAALGAAIVFITSFLRGSDNVRLIRRS